MSILIKGMEMPDSCFHCKLAEVCQHYKAEHYANKRHEDCPLEEVSCINSEKTHDVISRQAAIDADSLIADCNKYLGILNPDRDVKEYARIIWLIGILRNAPTIEPEPHWIPVTERLPEDLAEVNVTWINTDPEPYYDFVKDKPATGSAVYYKGDWYWYSSVTQDVLAEYGRMDSEKFDDAVRVIAWMPLPEPYKGEGD